MKTALVLLLITLITGCVGYSYPPSTYVNPNNVYFYPNTPYYYPAPTQYLCVQGGCYPQYR